MVNASKLSILLVVCVCGGLLLAVYYSSPIKAKGNSQTFSAGVVAAELPAHSHIEVLGDAHYCHLQSAERQDTKSSACYIYKNEQQLWVIESVNAICHAVCE